MVASLLPHEVSGCGALPDPLNAECDASFCARLMSVVHEVHKFKACTVPYWSVAKAFSPQGGADARAHKTTIHSSVRSRLMVHAHVASRCVQQLPLLFQLQVLQAFKPRATHHCNMCFTCVVNMGHWRRLTPALRSRRRCGMCWTRSLEHSYSTHSSRVLTKCCRRVEASSTRTANSTCEPCSPGGGSSVFKCERVSAPATRRSLLEVPRALPLSRTPTPGSSLPARCGRVDGRT